MNASNYSGNHLREKLSHQLETIVRKTQNNLEKGVYKNPNLTSINQLSPAGPRNNSRNYDGRVNSTHRSGFDQMEDPFFNYKHQQSQSSFIPMTSMHSPSNAELISTVPRPRTQSHWNQNNMSQPQINNLVDRKMTSQGGNEMNLSRERSASGLRDLSIELKKENYKPLGSGSGVGNVNSEINKRYEMDYKLQQELYSKLNENTNANAINIEQRQRIFEDIIIQRIKVIQNYCKKQYSKLKVEVNQSGGNSNPVILNSIHNDGMALELKIKEIVKWRMEAYDERQKQKEEKVMQLEVAINRNEKQQREMLTAITDASQQEFDITNQHLQKMEDRLTSHEQGISHLTEQLTNQLMSRVTANVTDTLLQSIMPQLDAQIIGHIERVDSKNSFDKKLDELKETLSTLKSQFQKSSDNLSEQLQSDLQAQQKIQQKSIVEIQDQAEEMQRKIKKFTSEIKDDIDSQQTTIDKNASQMKSLETQIGIAEAKLVTEKQVKELIGENIEDQGFITSDKLDLLQKQLQQKIDQVKMDLLDYQGDVKNDYIKDERVQNLINGLEDRINTKIQNLPKQQVVVEKAQAQQQPVFKAQEPVIQPKQQQASQPKQEPIQKQEQVIKPKQEAFVQPKQEPLQQFKVKAEPEAIQALKSNPVPQPVSSPAFQEPISIDAQPDPVAIETTAQKFSPPQTKKKMIVSHEQTFDSLAKSEEVSESKFEPKSSQPVSSKPQVEPMQLAPPEPVIKFGEPMITMGEISADGSPQAQEIKSQNSSMGLMSPLDQEPEPKLEMKSQPVSNVNRYQVSEEDEVIENDDINLDMLEQELDNGSPPPKAAKQTVASPQRVVEQAPEPVRNNSPINPADESWGVDSSSKESAAPPNLDPIVDDFEPDTQNLKDKKKDEARELAMPVKKEEEKPSYLPNKVPLIDPLLWKKIPINTAALVENAIDNKINNMIEDVLLEYHNIEKKLYKDVKDINKSLKASQKIKDLDIKNSINKISDISDLQDSKSVRDSIPTLKKAEIPREEPKKKTNVFDDLDDLEDLMF